MLITHCADVLKKRPGGHEVAGVQDDGGQHVQKEDVAGESGRGLLFDRVHDGTNNQTNADQKTWLRNPDGDLVINMETWEKAMTMKMMKKNTSTMKPRSEKEN